MMNIVNLLNKISAIGKYLVIAVLAINLLSVTYAGSTPSGITNAMKSLCQMSQQFLGLTAMLLVVLGGAVYAIGQMLGAETRARASVWATAMLIGAIIGIVIYLVTPMLIGTLLSGSGVTVTPDKPCG